MDPQSPQSTPAEPAAASDLKADGEGIRQAARESVSAGVDIRARVHDVTMLALKARKFDRHGVREVVGAVTDGLALGAEQSRGELRQALAEAFRGLDDALTRSAEAGASRTASICCHGKGFFRYRVQADARDDEKA